VFWCKKEEEEEEEEEEEDRIFSKYRLSL